jgi:hypothetical protein
MLVREVELLIDQSSEATSLVNSDSQTVDPEKFLVLFSALMLGRALYLDSVRSLDSVA